MGKLPDFHSTMRLQRENPEALERLRQELTSELVSNASNDTKRRSQGLQFRIDMKLRRAGNSTARFLKLSGMMQEAFSEQSYCLNGPLEAISEKHRSHKADIVQLFRKPSQSSHPSKH